MESQLRGDSDEALEFGSRTPLAATEKSISGIRGPEPRIASSGSKSKQKVSVACESCRRKRRKCDGLLPCTACSQSRTRCVYNAERDLRRQRPNRDTINELYTSQRVLEGLVKAIQKGYDEPYLAMIRAGASMQELAAAVLQETDDLPLDSSSRIFDSHYQQQWQMQPRDDGQPGNSQGVHETNITAQQDSSLEWLPYSGQQTTRYGPLPNMEGVIPQESTAFNSAGPVNPDGNFDTSLKCPSSQIPPGIMRGRKSFSMQSNQGGRNVSKYR